MQALSSRFAPCISICPVQNDCAEGRLRVREGCRFMATQNAERFREKKTTVIVSTRWGCCVVCIFALIRKCSALTRFHFIRFSMLQLLEQISCCIHTNAYHVSGMECEEVPVSSRFFVSSSSSVFGSKLVKFKDTSLFLTSASSSTALLLSPKQEHGDHIKEYRTIRGFDVSANFSPCLRSNRCKHGFRWRRNTSWSFFRCNTWKSQRGKYSGRTNRLSSFPSQFWANEHWRRLHLSAIRPHEQTSEPDDLYWLRLRRC